MSSEQATSPLSDGTSPQLPPQPLAAVDPLSLLMIVVVALFWGATNPFIRRGSLGYNNLKAPTRWGQLWLEVQFLISRWQYLLPLAVNQLGSVVYVFALQRTELSLVVPMANSLTFVFTAVTARLLGEQGGSWKTYTGMALVIAGTVLCSIEKVL
nr:transmembrane protein 234 homolog [Aedes albopictus]